MAEGAAATMQVETGRGSVDVAVLTRGDIDGGDVEYAVERVGTVLRRVEEPVLLVRVKLQRAADPARERPAIAEVSVDINGEVLRAHVAGHDLREVGDLLQRRLADKVEHRARHFEWRHGRSGVASPGSWRHGDLPSVRASWFDGTWDEREIVKRKTFAVDASTVEEAAFDMDQADYDFFLFRDLETGEDAVLERLDDGSRRFVPLAAAPTLSIEEASERLVHSGLPFAFFAERTTGRGNVIYRRLDGALGLITPA